MPVSTPEIPQPCLADTSASRGRMTLKLLRELPSDLRFRDEWNSLVESMESPQVFYTWEWAQAMCLGYGSQNLLLLTAHRADRLAGVVALATDRKGEVSFLTAATADYCDFVSAPEDREEFVRLAIARLHKEGVKAFHLANLPETSLTAAAIKSAMANPGYHLYSRPAYRCAQIRFSSQADRLEADKAARRRKSKSAKSIRSAEVLHKVNWEDWAMSFDDFAAAHVGRFLTEGKISNLVSAERRKFLRMLGELLGEKSWLAASMINLNGKPVSWHFGTRFAGTWFWYQPAFECDWLHAGPGTYLLNDLIQQASKDMACHTIDLGLGDEGYKQRYVTSVQQTLHVYANRSAARVAIAMCRYRAANFVRRWPRLEQALRKSARRIFSSEARGASKTFSQLLRTRREIAALHWPRQEKISDPQLLDCKLQPLSLKLLALAAMKYESDASAIGYLLQCAEWLKQRNGEALALLNSQGTPVFFCRTAFLSAIPLPQVAEIKMPDSCVLISDPWTPGLYREDYSRYLAAAAQSIAETGREPWILASTQDVSLMHDLKHCGFVMRFTIPRRPWIGLTPGWTKNAAQPTDSTMDFDTAA